MWQEYTKHLRACAHCGCQFTEIHLFCRTCWAKIDFEQSSPEELRQWSYDIVVYSLYSWREQKQVHSLIYGLKGGGLPEAFEYLATRFLAQRSLVSSLDNDSTVIIPAPASEAFAQDHAYEWGLQLARLMGVRLLNPLNRVESAPQKSLKKQERLAKKISVSKGLELHDFEKIIFVDDVITTGGTALAAYEALGRPEGFEVWTISCRPTKVLL